MDRFVLAGALAAVDFDLLISENVRNVRGYWGEVLEIRFPYGVVFAYIDEDSNGFIKIYRTPQGTKEKSILITGDDLDRKIKEVVEMAKEELG